MASLRQLSRVGRISVRTSVGRPQVRILHAYNGPVVWVACSLKTEDDPWRVLACTRVHPSCLPPLLPHSHPHPHPGMQVVSRAALVATNQRSIQSAARWMCGTTDAPPQPPPTGGEEEAMGAAPAPKMEEMKPPKATEKAVGDGQAYEFQAETRRLLDIVASSL